jgi:hypothetical protein
MESGDVIIIDKPKRKSPTPKKKEGEERTVIIYKLEITGTNFLYVGHTESYKQRLDNHRTACRANLNPNALNRNGKCQVYSEINRNGGWEKVTMTPVEEFVSKNTVQSRIREQYWIDKIQIARRDAVMMNSVRAFVTPEQTAEMNRKTAAKYHQEHREEEKAKAAKHYEKDREKKVTCPCGSEHIIRQKSQHLKSAKHIAWEKAKDQEFVDRLENEMDKIIENNI